MATNFFEHQDDARKRTGLLLFFFALGLATLVILVYALSAFLFLDQKADEPPRLWDPGLFATVAASVSAVVGGGSLLKMAELSSGGKSVALMLNGREIQGNTGDLQQRRVLNVVEEMAIAAGVPMPPVYLLPAENGINAFAAGNGPGDAVVAVSRGCLTYLTRDELQGVVGHEFSHILNGDMRLNLRVIGLIFGITVLANLGYILMRSQPSQSSSSGQRDNRGSIMVLGLGLYLLGMGGAFFGWLIQAAVSRQREFLADASAVQFTRNPEGIGGALKKIGGLQVGSLIHDVHAGEVSHMFLADAFMGKRFTDLLATHPPLDERIRRLDPQFDGVYPEVVPVDARSEPDVPAHKPSIPHGLPYVSALATTPVEKAVSQVGQVAPRHVVYAQAVQSSVAALLRDAAQSPFSARALIYALLLDARPDVRARQLASIEKMAEPRDYQATERLVSLVQDLPDGSRLPLVDLALPALRQMSPRQHEAFRAQVDALIRADDTVSLFEYALHCVLKRYLDADFNGARPSVRFTRPEQLAGPLVMVLAKVAWEGQADQGEAEAAFAAGLRQVAGVAIPQLPPRASCQLPAFDRALQLLAQAAPALKRQVVAACTACIKMDQQITVREEELLRAVCATLGCPMPPLVEGA